MFARAADWYFKLTTCFVYILIISTSKIMHIFVFSVHTVFIGQMWLDCVCFFRLLHAAITVAVRLEWLRLKTASSKLLLIRFVWLKLFALLPIGIDSENVFAISLNSGWRPMKWHGLKMGCRIARKKQWQIRKATMVPCHANRCLTFATHEHQKNAIAPIEQGWFGFEIATNWIHCPGNEERCVHCSNFLIVKIAFYRLLLNWSSADYYLPLWPFFRSLAWASTQWFSQLHCEWFTEFTIFVVKIGLEILRKGTPNSTVSFGSFIVHLA